MSEYSSIIRCNKRFYVCVQNVIHRSDNVGIPILSSNVKQYTDYERMILQLLEQAMKKNRLQVSID